MKNALMLVFLIGSAMAPVSAIADEVHLLCTGSERTVVGETTNPHTGLPDYIYGNRDAVRQIRFNEAEGQLWYSGASGLSKKNEEDGWIPAIEVVFEESKITATFKRSALSSISNFRGKLVAELDRLTGIWSTKNMSLQCELYDAKNRKF